MPDDKIRFIVMTSGRTGSSLLAAIMTDAGADFDSPKEATRPWEVDETPAIIALDRAANALTHFAASAPQVFGLKFLWRLQRSMVKRRLARLLCRSKFIRMVDRLVPLVSKIGFTPRIVCSFRRFNAVAVDKVVQAGVGFPEIADHYKRVYRNCLLYIHAYGGCAISYEELMDDRETAWAAALATVTGLEEARLLRARERQISRRQKTSENFPVMDAEADEVYRELRLLKGMAVTASLEFSRKRAQ
jgi:hypothetical protein